MQAIKLAPGEIITEPGVYDMSLEHYHSDCCDGPSISASGLKTLFWSPKHYWKDSYLNPNRAPRKEKAHFSLGSAAHHLLFLGRAGFDKEFVVRPDKWADWRTDASKAWRADAIAAGLTVITDDDLAKITGMARSLAAEPLVQAGILDGAVERSLVYRDPETGVWLKSRPDNITTASGDMSDLKSCADVSDEGIAKAIGEYGYNIQGALVGKAAAAVLGLEMQSFTDVFVESDEPHCVRFATLTDEDLARGNQQIEVAVRMFASCLDSGVWPGPGGEQQDAQSVGMNSWNAQRIDRRLERLKGIYPPREPQPFHHAAE